MFMQSIPISAQYWPATIPSIAAYPSVGVTNTGCDFIRCSSTTFNGTLKAIVSDGSNPKLFVSAQSGGTTQQLTVNLNSLAQDPDVALTFRGNGTFTAFAAVLVAYTIPGVGMYLDVYRYDFTNTISLYSTTSLGVTGGSNNITAINIDTDSKDYFAIVWDEQGAGHLSTAVGKITNPGGSMLVTLHPSFYLVDPMSCSGSGLAPSPYIMPDVAVYSTNVANNANDVVVYYTFVNANNEVMIQAERMNSLIAQVSYGTNIICSRNSNYVYSWPRIATQRYNATAGNGVAQTGVTMVYEMFNTANNTYDVGGTTSMFDLNSNSYISVVDYIYTDGSYWTANSPIGPYSAINSGVLQNSKPVVAYNNASGIFNTGKPVMTIGFTHFNGTEILPLCFYANEKGKGIASNATVGLNPQPFLEIPTPRSGDEGYLSISGEQTSNILYAWSNNAGSEILYKVGVMGNSLKIGAPDEWRGVISLHPTLVSDASNLSFSGISNNEEYQLKVISLEGKVVFSTKGIIGEIQEVLNKKLKKLDKSVYLISLSNSIGEKLYSTKIVLQ